ncbi:MAG: hypothetical protein ACI92G_002516, partial [Candidatus Pelagisphaera sp.]
DGGFAFFISSLFIDTYASIVVLLFDWPKTKNRPQGEILSKGSSAKKKTTNR